MQKQGVCHGRCPAAIFLSITQPIELKYIFECLRGTVPTLQQACGHRLLANAVTYPLRA
jgi:hypothetical protein